MEAGKENSNQKSEFHMTKGELFESMPQCHVKATNGPNKLVSNEKIDTVLTRQSHVMASTYFLFSNEKASSKI